MLNPNEIHQKHLAPMQAAILKHRSVVDEHSVSMLYVLAKDALYGTHVVKTPAVNFPVTRAKLENNLVVATCTDAKTGLFVQLVGDPSSGAGTAMLVFGQKFCQETTDPMRQNTATKIW